MYIINEEEYLTLDRYNKKILNLDDISKEDYFRMYSCYMYFFTIYLIKNTYIKKYDNLLASDSHKFVNIEKDNMDIYQRLASNLLKYFYIRNTLYLERLSKEEQGYLIKRINNQDYIFDDKMFNFIKNTYSKVIYTDIDNNDKIEINYGPALESYFALANSLVIGVRFDNYNLNGMTDDEWDKNYEEQLEILEKVIHEFESSLKSIFEIPCKVIEYNDFSIKKLTSNSKRIG